MPNGFYIFMHFYPWLAIPAALAGIQLAIHFKRQKKRVPLALVSLLAVFMASSAGGWFFFRGDLHARQWAKNTLEFFGIPAHYW
ncbi:hypothetical protein EBZ37_05995 [bacterium]|nr:hypothetical protein [bacterium]